MDVANARNCSCYNSRLKKTARKRAFIGILNKCKLKKGMNFVYITMNC